MNPGPSNYCEKISKKHVWFSTTKNPLKKARLRVSKLYREVQPLNWKYGEVQMLLNRSVRFMKLFNLLIENMAPFKCSWTASRGSWQRFNLAIENMERFKYVQDCSKYTTKEKKKIDDDKNGFSLFTISK